MFDHPPPRPDAPTNPPPRWTTARLWAGALGVLGYIAAWVWGGLTTAGYDPMNQAISELFAVGAPARARIPLVAGLVFSGAAMVAIVPVLHRLLPGRGRLGPALVALAGLGTLAVAAAPCSAGCPGAEAGARDVAHTLAAGVGYLALVLAPVAFAWRLRSAMPRLAVWSAVLGGIALVGMTIRYLGLIEVAPGLQQRVFNTVADAWYLVVAVLLLRGCIPASSRTADDAPAARGREGAHGPRTAEG